MSINMKFIALGSAGVVALAGAGVYAGTLATTTSGKVGSNTVALQSSCATAAVIKPGDATWDTTEKKFMYDTLTVTYTTTGTCEGQLATANVYANTGGAELSTNAVAHTITADEQSAKKFVIDLDDKVPADIAEADYSYGLVLQSPQT